MPAVNDFIYQLRTYKCEMSFSVARFEVPFNFVVSIETLRFGLFDLPSVYEGPITQRPMTIRSPSTLNAILEVASDATRRRREEEE